MICTNGVAPDFFMGTNFCTCDAAFKQQDVCQWYGDVAWHDGMESVLVLVVAKAGQVEEHCVNHLKSHC